MVFKFLLHIGDEGLWERQRIQQYIVHSLILHFNERYCFHIFSNISKIIAVNRTHFILIVYFSD